MSANAAGLRQRGSKNKPIETNGSTNGSVVTEEKIDQLKAITKDAARRDWDYKLAFGIITGLAFLTRFWGISHPDQVVFDEVHFGKVSLSEHGRLDP